MHTLNDDGSSDPHVSFLLNSVTRGLRYSFQCSISTGADAGADVVDGEVSETEVEAAVGSSVSASVRFRFADGSSLEAITISSKEVIDTAEGPVKITAEKSWKSFFANLAQIASAFKYSRVLAVRCGHETFRTTLGPAGTRPSILLSRASQSSSSIQCTLTIARSESQISDLSSPFVSIRIP